MGKPIRFSHLMSWILGLTSKCLNLLLVFTIAPQTPWASSKCKDIQDLNNRLSLSGGF